MRSLKTFKKALVACFVALGGQYGTVSVDGHISNTEWGGLVLVPVIAGLATWLIPNSDE